MIEVITLGINESLSDYPLYHSTSILSFSDMISHSMILKGYKPKYYYSDDCRDKVVGNKECISVTRNKNYQFDTIQFEFSRSKLGNKYKIVPYSERGTIDESEEVIVAKKIDLKKYVESIEVNTSPIMNKSGYKDIVKNFEFLKFNYINLGKPLEGITSDDLAAVGYLIYLTQKLGWKAGPNLKKLLKIVGKDAWKYIRIYPFNDNKVELPKVSNDTQKLLDELEILKKEYSEIVSKWMSTDNDEYYNQMIEISIKIKDIKSRINTFCC